MDSLGFPPYGLVAMASTRKLIPPELDAPKTITKQSPQVTCDPSAPPSHGVVPKPLRPAARMPKKVSATGSASEPEAPTYPRLETHIAHAGAPATSTSCRRRWLDRPGTSQSHRTSGGGGQAL